MLPSVYLTGLFVALSPVVAIWPAPSSITTGNDTLWISDNIHVTYNGERVCWPSFSDPSCDFVATYTDDYPLGLQLSWNSNDYGVVSNDTVLRSKDIVAGAVSRAMEAIFDNNFVPWKLYPRNKVQKTEPMPSKSNKKISDLKIVQTGKDSSSTWKPLAGEVDESYSLSVGLNGTAQIEAASAVGVLHALETFTQLFYLHSDRKLVYTTKAPVEIKDAPKFPHRGVLLDVARNWYPIESIYRTIRAMSWNKMNRLHIHVTDSQSWPLEIPSMPEIAAKGAYGKGKTYSPKDITAIQKYAIARGIEVIFEIDMPGHIGVVAESHPDVIVGWDSTPWGTYCAEPPCGQFRLNDSRVDTFLDKLMDDVLPRVYPYSAYFHTGGDEVNLQQYLLDPSVLSNESSVVLPLIQKFTDKNLARVRNAGLTPLVWEEIPSSAHYNVTIDDDVVVQSWLGNGAVKLLTSQGHKVIDSNYNYWYLDCGRGQWLTFAEVDTSTYYPFNDWCGPTKSWQLIYSHNPTENLTAGEAELVLGGEVAVWSETIDETNLDSLLWPRGSAAGEVLWSGPTGNTSQLEAAPRLGEFRERMVARGVGASPVQMVFCTQGMNATNCQLLPSAGG
ncbi:glycoside hydrolase superfamily [Pseudomassariella vexata]|uniref:Beta-hexosaminidase n=1 Tax=Pseudomassariella vexata TaxID=1141098 RepID=A0A1Y2E3S3_9PEZI|nr:glycoside hydrolase superfamily [Pseudomassariella vexata]ORY66208.1 glycoside hydrolase superfamily [Pseudomassariella vexata]